MTQDGEYQLFFVITLEAGRIQPDNIETLSLILDAAPIEDNYTIIVNKASEKVIKALKDKNKLSDFQRKRLQGKHTPGDIRFVPEINEKKEELISMLQSLLSESSKVGINKKKVKGIVTVEEKLTLVEDVLKDLEDENATLEGRKIREKSAYLKVKDKGFALEEIKKG